MSERAEVQWIYRGRERHFVVPEQAVHFAAADGEEHVRVARVPRTHRYLMMLIPPSYLDQIVASEGCDPPGNLEPMVGRHDPVLQSCLTRLAAVGLRDEARSDLGEAEASRQLVLRLAELNGCGRPDWSRDESVFDARSMRHFADFIDGNLRLALDLGFSSQSHFTNLFSSLTGMTPAKYRKQCGRTLG